MTSAVGDHSWRATGILSYILMDVIAISPLGLAFLARSQGADAYYLAVQEDGFVEWWTVFAFVLAGIAFGVSGLRARRGASDRLAAWWPFALAVFCMVVAMEEISWGQRLLGVRPPDYFLASNYQQEINLHNVASTGLRKFALLGVIFGYGVALPLAGLVPQLRTLLATLRILAPPLALAPAFLAIGALQLVYPFKFAGEWVECMLGLGFLGAALLSEGRSPARSLVRAVAWSLGTVVLGILGVLMTQARTENDPVKIEVAKVELDLLRADFRVAGIRTACGLHRRLHTYIERNGYDAVYEGRFAGLVEAGLPESRAAFLLDPWDSPYWVRDHCGDTRRAWIYSMGPNRRRDSTRSAIGGDDIAVRIR